MSNPSDSQVEGRDPGVGKGSPLTQQDGVRGGLLGWSCQFSVWGSLHGIKSLFSVEALLSWAERTSLKRTSEPNAPMALRLHGNVSGSPYHLPQGLPAPSALSRAPCLGQNLTVEVPSSATRSTIYSPEAQSTSPLKSPCGLGPAPVLSRNEDPKIWGTELMIRATTATAISLHRACTLCQAL